MMLVVNSQNPIMTCCETIKNKLVELGEKAEESKENADALNEISPIKSHVKGQFARNKRKREE